MDQKNLMNQLNRMTPNTMYKKSFSVYRRNAFLSSVLIRERSTDTIRANSTNDRRWLLNIGFSSFGDVERIQ